MQCQYRSYVELVVFLQKEEKLCTRVNCHFAPFKTFMLTICSNFNIGGNLTKM